MWCDGAVLTSSSVAGGGRTLLTLHTWFDYEDNHVSSYSCIIHNRYSGYNDDYISMGTSVHMYCIKRDNTIYLRAVSLSFTLSAPRPGSLHLESR